MSHVSRRTLLAGGAAASAAVLSTGSTTTPAFAAAPPAGTQAPAFYRYKVGDYEITAINDGVRVFPLPDGFVRNAEKEDVSAALEAAYLPKDQMTIWFNPMVINTGSQLVLIDTGNGPPQGTVGQFQANLAAAGIDPGSIDKVIISHFHGDHINGLHDGDQNLVYSNAEIMVPAPEWSFWMDDANMNQAPERMRGAFQNVRRVFGKLEENLTRYEADEEVAPGITSVATYGHTPGHMSFTVASGDGRLFVQSDVTNNPHLFVTNPDWHVMFDMDGPAAEATRRRVFDMVSAEKMLVAGFHFPFPAAGYIEKEGSGYRLVPVNWNPAL